MPITLTALFAACVTAFPLQGGALDSLTVVPALDLQRYAGTWYEIARFPNRFQKQCDGEVTATYTLLDDGTVRVVNRCRTSDGEWTEAEGKARRAREDGPTSILKVRFAPAFLSFLPFVWGDYWVIDLAEDYTYAVIGEPKREYLWILSRTPVLAEETYAAILHRASAKGFDVSKLVRTRQTAP